MNSELESLEAALGYCFKNLELLRRALTHRSSAHEKSLPEAPALDNEQLEFLGDAVLGFIVSDMLLARHPDYPEGRLSKLEVHLVSACICSKLQQVCVWAAICCWATARS